VREREDANRTRVAGNRDEGEGVVANTLNSFHKGRQPARERFRSWLIDWLGQAASPARTVRDNESATKCNEERPWERKIIEIMRRPNMEMMAQQHRNRHPDPRQTREPRERLATIVGVYARNGRRNQPSSACDVQEGNRSKHLEREMLHGPNEKEVSHPAT
jgi:hypothetical protein